MKFHIPFKIICLVSSTLFIFLWLGNGFHNELNMAEAILGLVALASGGAWAFGYEKQ